MPRILIIDDDADMVDSLRIPLVAVGFDVRVKMDTQEIVTEVKTVGPDLIILDVMFPEDPKAGFLAARALAADQETQQIPILILSAVNQRSNLSFSFSEQDISQDYMPVQGFLEKPIEPAVLLARVNRLLNQDHKI